MGRQALELREERTGGSREDEAGGHEASCRAVSRTEGEAKSTHRISNMDGRRGLYKNRGGGDWGEN